jgi:hypothetical protein
VGGAGEAGQVELIRALIAHREKLQDHEATRLKLDDFPTVRIRRLYLTQAAA